MGKRGSEGGKEYKKGGEKAQGFAAHPENINRNGRPTDPMVDKFRQAIDGVITPEAWAKAMFTMIQDTETPQAVKLSALAKIAEYRAPGIKLPPEADLTNQNIEIHLKM